MVSWSKQSAWWDKTTSHRHSVPALERRNAKKQTRSKLDMPGHMSNSCGRLAPTKRRWRDAVQNFRRVEQGAKRRYQCLLHCPLCVPQRAGQSGSPSLCITIKKWKHISLWLHERSPSSATAVKECSGSLRIFVKCSARTQSTIQGIAWGKIFPCGLSNFENTRAFCDNVETTDGVLENRHIAMQEMKKLESSDHEDFMSFEIALFLSNAFSTLRNPLVLLIVVLWKQYCYQFVFVVRLQNQLRLN